jgi:hypothetical protein
MEGSFQAKSSFIRHSQAFLSPARLSSSLPGDSGNPPSSLGLFLLLKPLGSSLWRLDCRKWIQGGGGVLPESLGSHIPTPTRGAFE